MYSHFPKYMLDVYFSGLAGTEYWFPRHFGTFRVLTMVLLLCYKMIYSHFPKIYALCLFFGANGYKILVSPSFWQVTAIDKSIPICYKRIA